MVGDAIGFKHSNYQHLSELIKNGFLNDSIQLFTIRQNNEVLGYACFYFHKNVINYLKGALSDKGKKYGAMYYAYLFRGNTQDAVLLKETADEGIKAMRSMLINRYHYMRSYMIPASTGGRRLGSARTTAGSSLDAL